MKQKKWKLSAFGFISIGFAIVVVLLAANLWQMNRENKRNRRKASLSECIEH